MERGKEKNKITKQRVRKAVKIILQIVYFSFTASVPVYVFYYTFLIFQIHFICAFACAFISFVIMDIICCITEGVTNRIYMLCLKVRQNKLLASQEKEKKEQEQIKQLENLLKERKDYNPEIQEAKKQNRYLKNKINDNTDILPKEVRTMLKHVCNNIDNILEILENDTEEYYPIRHTFKTYFPEFCKMTNMFIEIAQGDNLDKESISEFNRLTEEFTQYLDYIKGNINKQDKLNLNVGVKSLIKILETERKKGES